MNESTGYEWKKKNLGSQKGKSHEEEDFDNDKVNKPENKFILYKHEGPFCIVIEAE